jgi:hypothetical protein
MAVSTITYGTTTAFGSASNLNSLANDNSKPLGAVDNTTTKAPDYEFYLQLTLGSSGVSATGYIEVYLLESDTGASTQSTDGIDMAASADQDANIKNARRIAALAANANNQVVRWHSRLMDYVSVAPEFWSLLIRNMSGATLSASGNDADYTSIKYDFS